MKTLTELVKTTVGALAYGELIARSTKLRAPCTSGSNVAIERLKSTVQAK